MYSGSQISSALEWAAKAPAARPPTGQKVTDVQSDPPEMLAVGDTFQDNKVKNKVHTVLPITISGKIGQLMRDMVAAEGKKDYSPKR